MKQTRVLVAGVLLAGAFVLGVLWARGGRAAPAEKPATSRAAVIDAGRYPNLQAALDAVPEAGGVVHLPPGEFELMAPLVLSRENTRLEGAGDATRLVNRNQEGQPALVIRPKNRQKDKKARLWRVQLAHFRVSGTPKSGDGIVAEAINEIYICGLSIDHNGGNGISLVDCYENPRVIGCNITYNARAGLNLLREHDIVVSANQFEENQDAVRCIDSFNLCMNGNNIDDHLRHGVVIENTYGSVLSGNMIEECTGTAMVLDRDCYGITLSANVIAHCVGGGIDLRDAWGCAVTGNTFTIVAQRALVVGPGSGRITITGNNFSDSNIGGKTRRPKEDPATGIILQGTSDIVISGNVFTGLTGPAVKADRDCRRLAISGNVLADLYRGAKAKGPGLDLGGATGTVLGQNATEKNESPRK
jgi:parallel beta-helix repeat protein